jgi:potassium efflux system protein
VSLSEIRQKYEQALEALKLASGFTAKTEEYRAAIQSGPDKLAAWRTELQALNSDSIAEPDGLDDSASTLELQNELESRRVSLELLRQQLTEVTDELTRIEGRPVEIPARMAEVQRELAEIRQRLDSPEFAEADGRLSLSAEKLLLRANETELSEELKMLEQEQLSQSIRDEMLNAQQELLVRQITDTEQIVDRLGQLVNARLSNMAERIRRAADALPEEFARENDNAQAIATEVRAFADELEAVIEDAEEIEEVEEGIRLGRETLVAEFTNIREQLDLGGGGSAIVQLLYDLDRQCLKAQAELRDNPVPALQQPRLAELRVNKELRTQAELEKQLGSGLSEQLSGVIAARRQALEELDRQYSSLSRALALAEKERQQYLDQTKEVRDYIAEALFGFNLKACPAFGLGTLRSLPGSLLWEFQIAHWQEAGSGLISFATRMPFVTLGVILVATLLIILRQRLVGLLEQTGRRSRRISTDRYGNTGEALLWTVLLALPIPLLVGCTAWALGQAARPSDWLAGFQSGLQRAAWIVLVTSVVLNLIRRGGIGDLHFRWKDETLDQIRTAIVRTVAIYLPAFVLTVSCAYGEASLYLESLGRVSFMLAHLWMAYQMFRLFFGQHGILSLSIQGENPGILVRWRWLWLTLLSAAPLALVVLMAVGYMITSIILSLGLLVTLAIIAGGVLLHGFVLRWFAIKQRRLALNEALERRRASLEGQNEEEPTEVVDVEPEDAEELDLDEVAGQTRELLRAIFTLAVLIAVIGFWSEAFPVVDLIGSVTIPFLGGLTLLRLTLAVVIAAVTFIVVKNLPGLLELVVLRSKDTVPGTRLAIYTLCQYGATAIGVWLFLNAIQVDWAQFGWAVAALSVGIGFGLQEVVANFVCGLILLFERPIRVGDIVTVESMTGTVSKIHLRATTITNWDRQEFVVPNRTLITSTLLNWTLSAPLNRVVIPVGVAYGSDTDQARKILLSVAEDHPNVLGDPKPMATFEQFADSSLNIVLRVYLPDLDARLGTISELHTEIHQRFAKAGIEIAFPQRDLHLRGGWQCLSGMSAPGTSRLPSGMSSE